MDSHDQKGLEEEGSVLDLEEPGREHTPPPPGYSTAMGKDRYSVGPAPETSASEKTNGVIGDQHWVEVKDKNGLTTTDGEKQNGAVKKGGKEKDDGKDDDKKEKEKVAMVGTVELFRFADGYDRFMILMGMAMACIHGSAMPLMLIVFGGMMDTFLGNDQFVNFWSVYGANITTTYNVTAQDILANTSLLQAICTGNNVGSMCSNLYLGDSDSFQTTLNTQIVYFVIIGVCTMFVSFVELLGFQVSSARQAYRIQVKLFYSILRQEIGWFDTHDVGELNSRLSDDVNKIEQGTGEKLGNFFQYTCAAIAGFIVALVYGWKLTLVVLSVSPLLITASFLMSKVMSSLTTQELSAYAKAGAVAEEVLVSIRTVTAFGGQEKECDRYNGNLDNARKRGVVKGAVNGLTVGTTYLIFFSSYALAFWYGSVLVREDPGYTAGKMLIVFFCVMIGSSSLGNAAPSMQYLATAKGAAATVYSIIDQEPSIDSFSENGKKPDSLTGNIEFKGVSFQYPSRPDVPILNGLDLTINRGQTVALVGASGCGKSTTVSLLQRFYDPIKGSVMVDGCDIRELNIEWLRKSIGVVSQEPVLFSTTIAENIRYGNDDVTQPQIEAAAKNANAHDFIMKLPAKYETLVGERGSQLSGGQKQRIAIARALVRDPKILLLDEATSALDTTSESIVQSALDKARQGRTTIVIAHRLSTIKTADVIAGFDHGVIAEKGTHDELMQLGGIYYTLVMNQTNAKVDEEEKPDEEEDPDNLPAVPEKTLIRQKSLIRKQSSIHQNKSEDKDEELGAEAESDLPPMVPLSRIVKLNSPEWPYIILGSAGAMVSGSIQPVFSFIFASIISVFSIVDPVEQAQQALLYSMLFFGIAGAAFLGNVSMEYGLGVSGEYLTMRMRQMAFKALLRQEVGWFDSKEHSVGALTTRLSSDASIVKGATGSQLATILRTIAAVFIGLFIGFWYSWALTLMILAMGPVIFLSGFIRMKLVQGAGKGRDKQAVEDAGKVAVETVENIRTVVTLSKEKHFYEKYGELIGIPHGRKMKRQLPDAIAFGFSQGVQFLINAAVFSFGAYLITNHGLTFDAMFKVFAAVVFTAMAVGQSSSFAPDYGKAKLAAARIFAIIDREPLIDSYSTEGASPASAQGVVEICNVHFNYPNRPEVKVLQGLNVQVSPGQTLALVGASGCGKSTSIQLMERFYDADSGSLMLDGQDLQKLNLGWLRAQISLVSQEPMLFDCSIRENIEYGDLSRQVTMDEVIGAARKANIHEFIAALPEGYETGVGDKGAQLSGGQKQRIAIARALVRDPKILLLDEATSALDTESEKIVQEALDRAREGRTCIVIAHRLSTIRNADAIAVINNGVIAEIGTHSELMFREGLYYKLNNTQVVPT